MFFDAEVDWNEFRGWEVLGGKGNVLVSDEGVDELISESFEEPDYIWKELKEELLSKKEVNFKLDEHGDLR